MPSHEKLAEDLLKFYPRDFGTEYETNKKKLQDGLNHYFDIKAWERPPSRRDIHHIAGVITRYARKNSTAAAEWRDDLERVGYVVSETGYDIDGAHSPGFKRKHIRKVYSGRRRR